MRLDRLFFPRSVAVIGASRDPEKIGYSILLNLIKSKYRGRLYAVNPHASRILGIHSYRSILDVPKVVDLAIIVIPAQNVPMVLEECGRTGVKFVVIISSGFQEAGAQGKKLEESVVRIARAHRMRVVGPNCLGIVNTHASLNASFASEYPLRGFVSFISQSGAILVSLIDWSLSNFMPLSSLISLGNECDVSEIESLQHLGRDPKTRVIGMYLEEISNIREFVRIASEITKRKPIVVLKAGRSLAGMRAISSHTGSLASPNRIVSAALKQAGVIEVSDLEELFNVLRLFSLKPRNPRPETAVVSNAGGPAIIVVDEMSKLGERLAILTPADQRKLRTFLPSDAAITNPIDILGDADLKRFRKTLSFVAQLKKIGNICVIVTPQSVTPIEPLAFFLVGLQKKVNKHIVVCFIGGKKVGPARSILTAGGVMSLAFPYDALRTLSLSKLFFLPKRVLPPDQSRDRVAGNRRAQLESYERTQQRLLRAGFPIVRGQIVRSAKELRQVTKFPVALKALGSSIVHKKAAGGVILNIHSTKDALTAYHTFQRAFGRRVEGVLVQPMAAPGLELLLGAKRDSSAGLTILAGIGGTFTGVINDSVVRLAPVHLDEARAMLSGLTYARMLDGYDHRFVASLIVALSKFATANPDIIELDLNPVTVYTKGGCIVDARILAT